MNKTLFGCALLLFSVATFNQVTAEDADDVRAAIRAYVEAFNRADAEGIAATWSQDGVWISPGGDRIVGREAIKAEMESYFVDGGGHIEVIDPQIRILAPTVAIEEGRARVTRAGELPSLSSYIAIHVKEDDGWKLESVRETAVPNPPSSFEHLRELEWMVGTWVDRDQDASIETTCKWTKNRNFLTRSFRLDIAGKIDLEGTQVIGYDAAAGQIRSWIFDSAGGFGESAWQRDGNRWIVKNSQTLQDGAKASSINIITYIDQNTCTWSSHGREIDGELLPNIEPVTVTRVADEPPTRSDHQGTVDDTADEADDPQEELKVQSITE
jgi:uncharacterized protein (TIGR02246 family)